MLIAQELTYYGLISTKKNVSDLLQRLADIGAWCGSIHYAYPQNSVGDFRCDSGKGNICNYLDIPLQHAANSVLTAIKSFYNLLVIAFIASAHY